MCTLPSNKKCWGGSNLSITDKYKFYFTNASINFSAVLALEMLSVEVRFLPAAELNFYSDTMLYYASLTKIKQGVNVINEVVNVSDKKGVVVEWLCHYVL